MSFIHTLPGRLYLGLALFALLLLAGAATSFATQSSSAQTPGQDAVCTQQDDNEDAASGEAETDEGEETNTDEANEADVDDDGVECGSNDDGA